MAVKDLSKIAWHEHFYYDETSPSCLRRKKDWRCGKDFRILRELAGTPILSQDTLGYYVVKLNGTTYLCHRVIKEMYGGCPKDMSVDHIDGNCTNNKLENLRLVSHAVNHRNRKLPDSNISGAIGVSLNTDVRPTATYIRWGAHWSDLAGKRCSKFFSINKLGNEAAFQAACEYRDKMIKELNETGATYSSRHGEQV